MTGSATDTTTLSALVRLLREIIILKLQQVLITKIGLSPNIPFLLSYGHRSGKPGGSGRWRF